jgi:hypothetical protein
MTSNNFPPEWKVLFISVMCVNQQKTVLEILFTVLQSERLLPHRSLLSRAIQIPRSLTFFWTVAGLTVAGIGTGIKGGQLPYQFIPKCYRTGTHD